MYFKPFIMRTMNAIQSKKCRNMSHLYFTIIRFVVQSKYQHTKLAKVHSQWFFRLIPKMLSARIFPTAREKGLTQKASDLFLAEDKRFAKFAVPESAFASRCSLGFFDRCTAIAFTVSSTGCVQRWRSRRVTHVSAALGSNTMRYIRKRYHANA